MVPVETPEALTDHDQLSGRLSIPAWGGFQPHEAPGYFRARRVADPDGQTVDVARIDVRVCAHARTLDVPAGLYRTETCWRDGNVSYGQAEVPRHVETLIRLPRSDRPSTEIHELDAANVINVRASAWEGTWLALEHAGCIGSERCRTEPHRRWILVDDALGKRLASLPLGWNESLETIATRIAGSSLPRLTFREPEAGMMGDLLSGSNSESALTYARVTYSDLSAAELEAMAADRPLVMCAFAYAQHEAFTDRQWIEVLERAAVHGKWIPDIQVILGWRMLMSARDVFQVDAAAALLVGAMDVGIPHFSRGVRILSEALHLVNAMDGRAVPAAALASARMAAARTYPHETFTTFRI